VIREVYDAVVPSIGDGDDHQRDDAQDKGGDENPPDRGLQTSLVGKMGAMNRKERLIIR
jgi:hypothetical protein